MRIDREIFAQERAPRFGTSNPTMMDFRFWQHMVRTGEPAYDAIEKFDPNHALPDEGPVWCFDRFGPTRTALPDGRIICIGGEHEDYYDPDFKIYNDVIVIGRGGDEITIYGYPKDVFPPTDFHTATLYENQILIIGGLGYRDDRGGERTPIFRLHLDTFEMTRLHSTGPSPGWIYDQRAEMVNGVVRIWGGKVIRGEGSQQQETPFDRAAELVIADLVWREAAVPVDPDAVPELNWPEGWEPLDAGGADFALNNLRRETPPGHPLFAANVRPWATGTCEFDMTLLKLLDGSGRVAVVRLKGFPASHAKLPEPKTTFYDSLDDWLLASSAAPDAPRERGV